eukprot:m.29400 g.29400  ORF g.29400 m.29400 type:complete len:130 (-) comp9160_c1_seq1:5209-5598(-)
MMALCLMLRGVAGIAGVTGLMSLFKGTQGFDNTALAEAHPLPELENQFRFLAVSWIGYGATCYWVTLNLAKRSELVPLLAAITFGGAVARIHSYQRFGKPKQFHVTGIYTELLSGILLTYFYLNYSPTK